MGILLRSKIIEKYKEFYGIDEVAEMHMHDIDFAESLFEGDIGMKEVRIRKIVREELKTYYIETVLGKDKIIEILSKALRENRFNIKVALYKASRM